MKYYFNKQLDVPFDDAVAKVIEALGREGFGIVSDIDVRATLKKKLDADFRSYRILGACNPTFALRALQTEDRIGTMLPCNVVVQERDNGQIDVSTIDPAVAMQTVQNPALDEIAQEVRIKLMAVIERL